MRQNQGMIPKVKRTKDGDWYFKYPRGFVDRVMVLPSLLRNVRSEQGENA